MKLKWIGHVTFLMTAENGAKIITDPYRPDNFMIFEIKGETADVVTVSHDHGAHNYVECIGGDPKIYRGFDPIEVKGVKINAIDTFHDEVQGKHFGKNTVFTYDVDNIRLCHLGDLGHKLTDQQVKQIGKVDILMIPVGGLPCLTLEGVDTVIKQLNPKVIIPMHYRESPAAAIPDPEPPPPDSPMADRPLMPAITGLDEFLEGKNNIILSYDHEVEFTKATLPSETKILLLKPVYPTF